MSSSRSPESVGALVARIATGDRESAARFVEFFGDRLRARVRSELGTHIRRLFDSQDIMATVSRRFDQMVLNQKVAARSEPELIGLLTQMIRHAIVDKSRFIDRLKRAEGEDACLQPFSDPLRAVAEDFALPGGSIMERVFAATDDVTDRSILSLWLHDCALCDIAVAVGLTNEACRWRWHRMRGRLHDVLLQVVR